MIKFEDIHPIYEEMPDPEREELAALHAIDAMRMHVQFRDQMASAVLNGGTLNSDDERVAQRLQAEVGQGFN